jgi:hypothetical protein
MTKLFTLALTLLLLPMEQVADAAEDDFPPAREFVYGKDPDKNVKDWIRLILLLPVSSPPPIVFISPVEFQLDRGQYLVRLTNGQYERAVKYTRANQCVSRWPQAGLSLESTEYSQGRTRVCRMELVEACHYLSKIDSMHGNETPEPTKEGTIRYFLERLGCI